MNKCDSLIMNFDGEVAVVTGAATGIGEMCAKLFASRGANVVIMDFDKKGAERVADDISDSGGKALVSCLDLTNWLSIKEAVKKIENEEGICSSHGVTVSNNKDVLKTIGSKNSPKEIILFFGYAGWGPNQLESELARKDWLTGPADKSILFTPDINNLWDHARARYGLDL